MAENFYEILGITEEEKKLHGDKFKEVVDKKYKAIALKYHPDRMVGKPEKDVKEAEEIFKKANEAKETLCDENKRQQYDMQSSGFQGWNPFEGFDPFGSGFFRHHMHHQEGPMPEQGEDVAIDVKITLKDCFSGVEKDVTYRRRKRCSSCNGTGSADGNMHLCPECNGSGFVTKTYRQGITVISQSTTCPKCHGTGKTAAKPCGKCNGTGYEFETVTEKLQIPKGIDNGMTINFPGKGSEGRNGGGKGNLIVKIVVTNDSKLSRFGENLVYNDEVNFADAMLGYEKTIENIDGSKITVKVHELSKDNEFVTFKGKGMPKIDGYGRVTGYGDLAYVVKYKYPSKLSKKQKELLNEWKKS